MRRLLVIAALTASTAACASASAPSTEPAPADVAVVPVESTTTPEVVDPSSSAAGAGEQVVRMISLPAPSGDPELDALGAEIAGLEEQLAALDAAAADFGGMP